MTRTVEELPLAMWMLAAPGLRTLDPAVPPVPWPDWKVVSLEGLRVVGVHRRWLLPARAGIETRGTGSLRGHARGAEVEEWAPPGVANAVRIFLGIASAAGGVTYHRRALGQNERDRRISRLLRAAGLPSRARPVAAGLLERAGQRHMCPAHDAIGDAPTRT